MDGPNSLRASSYGGPAVAMAKAERPALHYRSTVIVTGSSSRTVSGAPDGSVA